MVPASQITESLSPRRRREDRTVRVCIACGDTGLIRMELAPLPSTIHGIWDSYLPCLVCDIGTETGRLRATDLKELCK